MVFLNMWIKEGTKEMSMKKEPLTVDEVIKNVWQNCHHSWVSLGRKLVSGDITFKEFQEHFEKIPNDNLHQQLMYLSMTNKNDWVHVRIRQYQCFRTLDQYVHIAKLILDITICYDLRGDFQPIKIIEEMVCKISILLHSCMCVAPSLKKIERTTSEPHGLPW